jgi:RNase H-like domain found in reverse transcriptase/Integrase zinc binding domain/Reverse transcriptase (RNA-dependent DNA polymerase)
MTENPITPSSPPATDTMDLVSEPDTAAPSNQAPRNPPNGAATLPPWGWIPAAPPLPSIPPFEGHDFDAFLAAINNYIKIGRLQSEDDKLAALWTHLAENVRFRTFVCDHRPDGPTPHFSGLLEFLKTLYGMPNKNFSLEDLRISFNPDHETLESHIANFGSILGHVRISQPVDENTACDLFFLTLPNTLRDVVCVKADASGVRNLTELYQITRNEATRKANRFTLLNAAQRPEPTRPTAPPPLASFYEAPVPTLPAIEAEETTDGRYRPMMRPQPPRTTETGYGNRVDIYALNRELSGGTPRNLPFPGAFPDRSCCIYCRAPDHLKRSCVILAEHMRKGWVRLSGPQNRICSTRNDREYFGAGETSIRDQVEAEYRSEKGSERPPSFQTNAIQLSEEVKVLDEELLEDTFASNLANLPKPPTREPARRPGSDDVRAGQRNLPGAEERAPYAYQPHPSAKGVVDAIMQTTFAIPGKALLETPAILRSLNYCVRANHEATKQPAYQTANARLDPFDDDELDAQTYHDGAPRPTAHQTPSVSTRADPDGEGYRSAACGTLSLRLNGQEITACVDNGSEINLLSLETAKRLGLPIKRVTQGSVVGVGSQAIDLIGICEHCPTDVAGIEGRASFFVSRHLPHVLLGRPFELAYQARHETDSRGNQWSTYFSEGKQASRRVLTASAADPRIRKAPAPQASPSGMSPTPPPLFTAPSSPDAPSPPMQTCAAESYEVRATLAAAEEACKGAMVDWDNVEMVGEVWVTERNKPCADASALHENPGCYTSHTLRKRVADKVRPANVALSGENPQNDRNAQNRWAGRLPDRPPLTDHEVSQIVLGDQLTAREKVLFIEMLQEKRRALSFGWDDLGCLDPSIERPVLIRTVEHEPWCLKPIRFSQTEWEAIVALLQERLSAGILERSEGPYSSRFFLVKKKNGKYRFIQDVRNLNAVTIKDAHIPPNLEDLVDRLAGYPIYTLLDAFSGYDQIPLDPASRDLTAMWTPLGTMRMTRLPQGYTNSPAVYERIMSQVLGDAKGRIADNLLDDITVKPEHRHKDDSLLENGARTYVWNHLCDVRDILTRLEKANLTVSAEKAVFGTDQAKVLGHVLSPAGRQADEKRVAKIVDWARPKNLKQLRGFLALVTGVSMYFPHAAETAEPLIAATRGGAKKLSDTPVEWTPAMTDAFESLKQLVQKRRTLRALNPDTDRFPLYVYTDAGEYGVGAALMQAGAEGAPLEPIRFESKIFNAAQRTYSTPRKELYAIMVGLKKLRPYIMNRKFTVRLDSSTVFGMLRNPGIIPDPMVTRWIASIIMFNPDLEKIPRELNALADGLGRLDYDPASDSDGEDPELEKYAALRVVMTDPPNADLVCDSRRGEAQIRELLRAEYPRISERELDRKIQTKTHSYTFEGDRIFCSGPLGNRRRVVLKAADRRNIMSQAHSELGHRGREATYAAVARRHFWPGMYQDVKAFVAGCDTCQRFKGRADEGLLASRPVRGIMEEVALDHVHIMKEGTTGRYLLNARCTFSGWVEARVVADTSAKHVVDFLEEEVFARHGPIPVFLADNGTVSAAEVRECIEKKGGRLVTTTPYNPRGNAVVERGHAPLVKTLAKLRHETRLPWQRLLSAALWADRSAIRSATGHSAYYLLYGHEPLLPFDLVDKYSTASDADLRDPGRLERCLKHILDHNATTEELRLKTERRRMLGREVANLKRQAQAEPLLPGDLVLLLQNRLDFTFTSKLEARWQGPFQVREVYGSTCEVVDSSGRRMPVSRHRLKKYRSNEPEALPPAQLMARHGARLPRRALQTADATDLIPRWLIAGTNETKATGGEHPSAQPVNSETATPPVIHGASPAPQAPADPARPLELVCDDTHLVRWPSPAFNAPELPLPTPPLLGEDLAPITLPDASCDLRPIAPDESRDPPPGDPPRLPDVLFPGTGCPESPTFRPFTPPWPPSPVGPPLSPAPSAQTKPTGSPPTLVTRTAKRNRVLESISQKYRTRVARPNRRGRLSHPTRRQAAPTPPTRSSTACRDTSEPPPIDPMELDHPEPFEETPSPAQDRFLPRFILVLYALASYRAVLPLLSSPEPGPRRRTNPVNPPPPDQRAPFSGMPDTPLVSVSRKRVRRRWLHAELYERRRRGVRHCHHPWEGTGYYPPFAKLFMLEQPRKPFSILPATRFEGTPSRGEEMSPGASPGPGDALSRVSAPVETPRLTALRRQGLPLEIASVNPPQILAAPMRARTIHAVKESPGSVEGIAGYAAPRRENSPFDQPPGTRPLTPRDG